MIKRGIGVKSLNLNDVIPKNQGLKSRESLNRE